MKKVLILIAAGLILAACASSSKSGASSSVASTTKPAFTDRELTNVQAPKLNYASDISYEDQLRATGTYIRGIKGKDSSNTAGQ
ncbi:MAG: hypothetical protein FWF35_05550 [Elusimicrobia bacterium]|nr:hypothetical protein [Elusimicrobiota bacterium]